MHGNAIAHSIIAEAKKAGAARELSLVVGELAAIEAEELKESLASHVSWKIHISREKSRVKCSCGYVGSAEIIEKGHGFCLFRCPECKGSPEVLKGREIRITGVK